MGSLVMSCMVPHREYDFIQVGLFVLIIITLNIGRQLEWVKLSNVDEIIMPIYIWQVVAVRIVCLTGDPDYGRLLGLLFLDVLLSVLWVRIAKRVACRKTEV